MGGGNVGNQLEIISIVLNFVVALLVVIYAKYLLAILPVFLGGLIIVASIFYFVIALVLQVKIRLPIILLAIILFIGGIIINIYSFGFGGIEPLAKMLSTLLVIAGINELLINHHYRTISRQKEGGMTSGSKFIRS